MGMDGARVEAQFLQQVQHRAQAIEAGRIEGGAEEAPAVRRVGHASALLPLVSFQRPEGGIPSGVARAQAEARRRVQEARSEEHTSELQSLMRISYAVFCLKKKNHNINKTIATQKT